MTISGTRRRWARVAALALLIVVILAVTGAMWLAESFDLSVSTLPYAMVGTAIIWQRPRARIGWVLLVFALLWSATFLGVELAVTASAPGLIVLAAWLSEWTWFPALVSVFVVLPILFPTGKPLSNGWAAVLWMFVAMCAGFVVATSVQARFSPTESVAVANPWRLLDLPDAEALLVPAAVPLLLLGPAATVVRFRRSTGVERQQIRWFMYAALTCGTLFAANAVVDEFLDGPTRSISEVAFALALSLPPVGVWVAINPLPPLRHRPPHLPHRHLRGSQRTPGRHIRRVRLRAGGGDPRRGRLAHRRVHPPGSRRLQPAASPDPGRGGSPIQPCSLQRPPAGGELLPSAPGRARPRRGTEGVERGRRIHHAAELLLAVAA